jgi:hypothetical protein
LSPEVINKIRKQEDLAEIGQHNFKEKYQKFIHYNEQNLKTLEMREYFASLENANPIKLNTDIIAEEMFNFQ